jgi:hypothetical protein
MTARLIVLRPRPVPAARSVPFSSSQPSARSPVPSSWSVPLVRVEWDGVRGLNIARCSRCADSFTSTRVDAVEEWAATHRCDAELAALLAEITSGRAA